jgi:hypothetical protein
MLRTQLQVKLCFKQILNPFNFPSKLHYYVRLFIVPNFANFHLDHVNQINHYARDILIR